MGIIAFIIFGAISGFIASKIMKVGSDHKGFVANVVLGILGSMVGGFLLDFFGGVGVTGFNIYSFFVAIFGAVVVVWVIRQLRSN